ncbi:hypothetical protein [Clavibacter tessellarius]|uniref:hypothetical protein n=1 Tax=Clavibacter tessellarius TaxID=31965 RepID=UPI00324EBB83
MTTRSPSAPSGARSSETSLDVGEAGQGAVVEERAAPVVRQHHAGGGEGVAAVLAGERVEVGAHEPVGAEDGAVERRDGAGERPEEQGREHRPEDHGPTQLPARVDGGARHADHPTGGGSATGRGGPGVDSSAHPRRAAAVDPRRIHPRTARSPA